ncbi:MAG: hypothetical protein IKL41_04650 [Clostridia bacterium]|nr:hypothetical protein [Clostridia bacterium]MBR6634894.1 hypothetical protein [Clostridia bacterium]
MTTKKILAVILAAIMLVPTFMIGANAENAEYTIISPYDKVIWEGDGAWGAYKGTLHTHTTYSDADLDLSTMIKGYYNEDYDFVANSDHGVTGVEWNKEPARPLLYLYQYIIGNKVGHLTDEEYEAMTTGTYPLEDGTPRNKKMVCVTGANEFGYITLTKSHTNGFFLPADIGNAWDGGENSFEEAISFVEENGGLSHIDHPGDWLDSNSNPDIVNDPASVKYFGDILLKYKSCLGTEVFNERNGTTGYDRILWDNLLMYCLPYGKNVLGYSNTDAHWLETIDSSFSVFMMEENDMDHIKETMQSGAFFAITRKLRGNNFEIGPKEEFDVIGSDLPYPMFTKLTVDGHKITAAAKDAQQIQFIANGKVIAKQALSGNGEYTLDLDTIEGAEDFLYVRAELLGEGGMCASQALVIDNGSEPLTFEEEEISLIDKIINWFKDTRLYVIFQELSRAIG